VIESLISGLRAAGFEFDAVDLLDAIWLARFQRVATSTNRLHDAFAPPMEAVADQNQLEDNISQTRYPAARDPLNLNAPDTVAATSDRPGTLYAATLEQASTDEETISASPMRIPAGEALPEGLNIARAMRGLAVRVKSRTEEILDEDATADATARNRGKWLPRFRPKQERLFEAVLVVEHSPSIEIWAQTIVEVERLLSYLGAFRDLHTWRLHLRPEPKLVRGTTVLAPIKSLCDPSSRRVIFFFTQGTSPDWISGALGALLEIWARSTPVVLIHALPPRMWKNTALGEPKAVVWSTVPARPNVELRVEPGWWTGVSALNHDGLTLPFFNLDPDAAERWAEMLMGRRGRESLAFRVRSAPQTRPAALLAQPTRALEAEERVNMFRANASEEAFTLAVHLAAGPMTLPIIHLVHSVVLGTRAAQSHVAEVMLSGLVERVTPVSANIPAERVRFRFDEKVRPILLRSLRRDDAARLTVDLQNHIEKQFGNPNDFLTWISSPRGKIAIPASAEPFAELRKTFIDWLGTPTLSREAIPARVFISYSHDSLEHMNRVLELSNRLRSEGVDAEIDRYEQEPPEGWPRWCDRKIENAQFVVVICTETYQRRFEGKDRPGQGQGAKWEGAIVIQKLYEAGSENTKFIPVLFSTQDTDQIPRPLLYAKRYVLDDPNGYEKLYRRLTSQSGQLAPLRPFAAKEHFLATAWNVPQLRNPFFTGRDVTLNSLHTELLSHGRAALSGMGGIGKTQVAIEYAYRYRAEYGPVLWVRANSRVALIGDFVAIARLLSLPVVELQEEQQIVAAVKNWLGRQAGWLLVFDDVDTPELLAEFLPLEDKGHVLLTSRKQVFDAIGIDKTIEVGKMAPDEAYQFLLSRTAWTTDATDFSDEFAGAQTLAQELGYLPLSLEQAGAYIAEKMCGFTEYLGSYRRKVEKLGVVTGEYPATVAAAWLLNVEQVEQISNAAADLLHASAFLSQHPIPLQLVRQSASELGPALAQALRDGGNDTTSLLDQVLETLMQYSLIHRDVGGDSYDIHRLLQSALKQQMEKSAQQEWAERCVRAVNRAFPNSEEITTWPLCEHLLPHALACVELVHEWSFALPEAARLCTGAGYYLSRRGRYQEAEPLYRLALVIREKILRPQDLEIAESLNNLAELYRNEGKYPEAEPLYQRALAIMEEVLGPKNPNVAICLNNLALLYYAQGKYTEAERGYQRALSIIEQALEPQQPTVASTLNNLAALYNEQGRYIEAEPLLQRALHIREQVLGRSHPDVAASLNNLAELYREQSKYARAEPLLQRALQIREQVLGRSHPDVGESLNNLAGLYYAQGQYHEAEPLYHRALAINEQVLGPMHPSVATSLNNLAGLYREQGRYNEAEPLYRRALAIYEQVLGPLHPSVATSLNNLAGLYHMQGNYAQAESLYQRALAIYEQTLGQQHPSVATSLNNLAELYRNEGKYAEAVPLYQRALAMREQALGLEHPDVAESLTNLAELYRNESRYAEAEPFYQRALAIYEQALGSQHPITVSVLRHHEELLRQMGRENQTTGLESPVTQAISVIVSVLALGAAAGLKESVAQGVKDAYSNLKALIRRKYAPVSLLQLEAKPESKARRDIVEEELIAARAQNDEELLQHVKAMLDALEQQTPETGAAIGVDLEEVKGAALRIANVGTEVAGVRVRQSEFSGNVSITGIRVGQLGEDSSKKS